MNVSFGRNQMNSSILHRLAALLLDMKGRRIEKGRQDVTEGEREG